MGSAILVLDDVERLTSKDKLVDAKSQLWRQSKEKRGCIFPGATRCQYIIDFAREVFATYIAWLVRESITFELRNSISVLFAGNKGFRKDVGLIVEL